MRPDDCSSRPLADALLSRSCPRPALAFLAVLRALLVYYEGACGKTSLLCSFALGEFPKEYVSLVQPTTRDHSSHHSLSASNLVRACFSSRLFPTLRRYSAIFENYVAEIRLDGKPIQLALWDTA